MDNAASGFVLKLLRKDYQLFIATVFVPINVQCASMDTWMRLYLFLIILHFLVVYGLYISHKDCIYSEIYGRGDITKIYYI